MTWLTELPDGDTDWERFTAAHPEPLTALAGLLGAAYEQTDPVLAELARLRTAMLLRYTSETDRRSGRARAAGLTDEQLADLASWPTSPHFTDRERACLALTEQFVLDANSVTEAHVGAVAEHLGSRGCFAFVQALSAIETFLRACLTLGIHTAPDVDALIDAAAARTREAPTQAEVPT